MRKIIVGLFCLMGFAANATGYTHLTFQTADGTTQKIAVESLELTFADGKLTASNGASNLAITLTELSKMFFTDDNSGVEAVEVCGAVEVYSVAGVKIGDYKSAAQAVKELPAGVYLFKSQGQTQKVVVK